MGRSIWQRLFGRTGGQPREAMSHEVEHLLRVARPEPPELLASRADYMLEQALAQARSPRRPRLRTLTLVAALGFAGCCIAAVFLFEWHPLKQGTRDPAVAAVARPRKQRLDKLARVTSEAHVNRQPVLPTVARGHPKLMTQRSRRRHRFWAVRALPPHHTKIVALVDPPAPDRFIDVKDSNGDNSPAVAVGHMVIVVSTGSAPTINVQVTSDSDPHSGFAKAEAYTALGPGGGVLTQCTIRGDAEPEEVNTTSYGIVYGEPASLLREEDWQPSDADNNNEDRIDP